jgi:multiple inositol-polyphosphate phosphatase/2,3-bisphosphoglycerate 3-phosphatase
MLFRQKSQGLPGPKGVFYFAHSSNVLSTIAGLGFANDSSRLLSSNYEEMQNRKWRSSYLDPFASNIIAALYECDGDHKVTFYVNEIPMVVEKYGCTLCPWEKIEKMFDPIVSSSSCSFYQSTSSATLILNAITLVFFICSMNILTSLY